MFCFFKQKTSYEMLISDWSSDVCSSDLPQRDGLRTVAARIAARGGDAGAVLGRRQRPGRAPGQPVAAAVPGAGTGGRRPAQQEIGRASCRERVWPYVSIPVGVASSKKKPTPYTTKQIITTT